MQQPYVTIYVKGAIYKQPRIRFELICQVLPPVASRKYLQCCVCVLRPALWHDLQQSRSLAASQVKQNAECNVISSAHVV